MCEFLQLGHRPGLVKRVRLSKTKPQERHLYGVTMSFFSWRCKVRSICPKWSIISFSWRLTAWERSRMVNSSEFSRSIISCLKVCLLSKGSINHQSRYIREHKCCHYLLKPWSTCIQESTSGRLFCWFQFFVPGDENGEGILPTWIRSDFQP